MPEHYFFVFFGILVVLGIVLSIYVHHLRGIRTRGLERWAGRHGWTYRKVTDRRPALPFPLFRGGRRTKLESHLSKALPEGVPGLSGALVDLFQYTYQSGDNEWKYSCAMVEPGLELGALSLRPERRGDRLLQALGGEDIDLEDPEFSAAYVLGASRKKDAYRVIGRRMMDYLVASQGFSLETRGPLFLVFRRGALDVWAVEDLLDFVTGFLAHLPRPLVNEERSRRGLPSISDAGDAAPHFRA